MGRAGGEGVEREKCASTGRYLLQEKLRTRAIGFFLILGSESGAHRGARRWPRGVLRCIVFLFHLAIQYSQQERKRWRKRVDDAHPVVWAPRQIESNKKRMLVLRVQKKKDLACE